MIYDDHVQQTKEQMINCLKEGICHVEFIKADGSTRIMNATLKPDLLPAQTNTTNKKTSVSENISVFDVDLQEWRSFIVSGVIKFIAGE